MKTIFILEKNSERQNQMNHNLTAMGFVVCFFGSIAEVVEVNDKPFLIIVDEKMSDGEKTGIQFLRKIRKKMSNVPIVYMTSGVDAKLVSDATKMGAYEVIEKNSAEFVNLRTTLDKIVNDPPRSGWFSKLFTKGQSNILPALSV